MKHISAIIGFSLLVSITYSQEIDFHFMPDPQVRVDCVAISHATMVNDTLFLFYSQHLFDGSYASRVGISTASSDWLLIDTTHDYNEFRDYFIRYQMPDGVFRRYRPDSTLKHVLSESSLSGHNFATDPGIRYTLPPADSSLGVGTYYCDTLGGTHYIYNTTNQTNIGCRKAYSFPGDNGLNFVYVEGNVFGDSTHTSNNSYVDPNAILNCYGRQSIFVMCQHGLPYPPAGRLGIIHSFSSANNGSTFLLDKDGADSCRLRFDDFDGVAGYTRVSSLNDPKVVRLPDGRYRIYLTLMLVDTTDYSFRWAIGSATAPLVSSVHENSTPDASLHIYPDPAKDYIICSFIEEINDEADYFIYSITGQLLCWGKISADNRKIDISSLSSGSYLIHLQSNDISASGLFVKD